MSDWRKSTHSNSFSNCAEVAVLPDGTIAIRDSKAPRRPGTPLHAGRVGCAPRPASSTTSPKGPTMTDDLDATIRTHLAPLASRRMGSARPDAVDEAAAGLAAAMDTHARQVAIAADATIASLRADRDDDDLTRGLLKTELANAARANERLTRDVKNATGLLDAQRDEATGLRAALAEANELLAVAAKGRDENGFAFVEAQQRIAELEAAARQDGPGAPETPAPTPDQESGGEDAPALPQRRAQRASRPRKSP